MLMRRALKRWIAVLLLGALGFSQVSLALAACLMDRGSMAQMSAMSCDCGASEAQQPSAACVAHCTADLQLAGVQPAIVPNPADAAVLVVSPVRPPASATSRGLEAPPPGTLSRRVLLHSYLI